MEVITKQVLASKVPDIFSERYSPGSFYGEQETHKNTREALLALDHPINPDKVDEIIGNTSWTRIPVCDECGEHPEMIVLFSNDYGDQDCRHIHVCEKCIHKSLRLIGATKNV